MKNALVSPEQIRQAHQLYCQLTGQTLSLGFARERLWYELLRLGYGPEQIQNVIRYLQREIRHGRRYVGALKLSNLLQPDRFEEDLNISRVQLKPLPPKSLPAPSPPHVQGQGRKRALLFLQHLKAQLSSPSSTQSENHPTSQSEQSSRFTTTQSEKIPTE